LLPITLIGLLPSVTISSKREIADKYGNGIKGSLNFYAIYKIVTKTKDNMDYG
jgi:hypothetical protein